MNITNGTTVTDTKSKNAGYFSALFIITASYISATLIANIPFRDTPAGILLVSFGFLLTFIALISAGILRSEKDGTFKDSLIYTVLFPLLFQASAIIVLLPIPMEVSQWWDNFAVQYDGIDLWEFHVGEFVYFIIPLAVIVTALLAIKPVRTFSMKWSATKRRTIIAILCATIIISCAITMLHVQTLRAYDNYESGQFEWSAEGIAGRVEVVNERNAKIAETELQGVVTTITFAEKLNANEVSALVTEYNIQLESKVDSQFINGRIDAKDLAALQSDPRVFLADTSGDGYFRGHKSVVSHDRNDIIINRMGLYPFPISEAFEYAGLNT
ncbi:hypothetical protein FACS18949_16340 [Clostridia bacterium]|nr:hypothetical protein FACS18949_16340 [Clostridia bacterium]